MASRANNKYASLNFNDIYEKKFNNNNNNNNNNNKKQNPISSSSSLNSPSKTILSNSRIHGNMLVLSRPSPKPISQPSPPPSPAPLPQPQQTRSEPDPISLRPLGRTGSASPLSPSPLTSPKEFVPSPYPSPSAKKDKFVPPHLRPGFVGREEKPDLGDQRYGEDGRPKSGGGYERMRRGGGGESDLVEMNRPGSSGTRPSSSGYWLLPLFLKSGMQATYDELVILVTADFLFNGASSKDEDETPLMQMHSHNGQLQSLAL